MFYIHLLPASFGDAILIEYGDTSKKYILIDGGPYFNFEILEKSIQKIAPDLKTLELLIVTHIDIDHIDGVIMLLNQKTLPFAIKEIWYNGFEEMQTEQIDTLGVVQGEYLTALIKEKNIPHNTKFKGKAIVVKDYNNLPEIALDDGMVLTLLGPNKQGLEAMRKKWKAQTKDIDDQEVILKRLQADKRYEEQSDDLLGDLSIEDLQNTVVKGDKSEANGSSIACIATYKNKSCLLVGDLFTEHLEKSIDALIKKRGTKKLIVDAWKLAHHGSKKSTLDSLMAKIDTKNILISSDGKRYHHPDKETIAKLIKNLSTGITFYFNYKTAYNDMWSDTNLQAHYRFKSIYPQGETEKGISIKLL